MFNDPIVVGYDDSPSAHAAARWALEEAARHRTPVRLVYAVDRPLRTVPIPPMPGEPHPDDERHQAQELLDRAVAELASTTRPDVEVTGAVLTGPAVTVLCEQSERAGMLVLGSRGKGGFTGLFIGSVSLAVATHAHCPVVVIRDDHRTHTADLPTAVGVDESASAQLAVGFAIEEAALRGVGLLAVRAWTPPSPPWHNNIRPLVAGVAELEMAERHVLSKALHGWREKYPGVTVTTRLIPTDARHALATVSHEAQLVVVGSRGQNGFSGLLLGSVSHYLLHHAACPVAVIRGRASHPPATQKVTTS